MLEKFLPTWSNRLEFNLPAGIAEDPIKVLRPPSLPSGTRSTGKSTSSYLLTVRTKALADSVAWPWVDFPSWGTVPSGRMFAQKDPIYQNGDGGYSYRDQGPCQRCNNLRSREIFRSVTSRVNTGIAPGRMHAQPRPAEDDKPEGMYAKGL